MKRSEFEWLVRDALGSLHDWAALETHPLAASLADQGTGDATRAEQLRMLLVETIARLRPDESEPDHGARPWRPYLILTGRYVEGLQLRELETQLALSTRQLGREHTRALQALSSLLQAQLAQNVEAAAADDSSSGEDAPSEGEFEINLEPIDVGDVVRSVVGILQRQAQSRDVDFVLSLAGCTRIRVDRVIFRQVLLSVLSHALHACADGRVSVRTQTSSGECVLRVAWEPKVPPVVWSSETQASSPLAGFWTERMGGRLVASNGLITLTWPRGESSVVLVVDDQAPAIRLFERYLGRTGLRVVGTREPERVLDLARELQPQVITLDVMMPTMDGWEVLQQLKSDPDTGHIPVIICTIWDVADVASGFGAAGFLEKPVTQRALLTMLEGLGVTDIVA